VQRISIKIVEALPIHNGIVREIHDAT